MLSDPIFDRDRALVLAALNARAHCRSSLPAIINAEDLMRPMERECDRLALIDRLCELGFLREIIKTPPRPRADPYRTFTWIGP
mgnify:FL=1